MITENTRLALSDDVARRGAGRSQDEVVLTLKTGQQYNCTDMTAKILKSVDGNRRICDIVEKINGPRGMSPERLSSQVLTLTKRLLAEGLVVVLPDADAVEDPEEEPH